MMDMLQKKNCWMKSHRNQDCLTLMRYLPRTPLLIWVQNLQSVWMTSPE